MPVTSLRKPCVRPPEVAIGGAWTIARLEAEQEQDEKAQMLVWQLIIDWLSHRCADATCS
jgi:hypothetical protein